MVRRLKKLAFYINFGYFSSYFPSIASLLFSQKKVLLYYGYLGDDNFGDVWVYESAKNLFPDCILLPIHPLAPISSHILKSIYPKKISGLVIGGGTLIGPRLYSEREVLNATIRQQPIYVHGTGVHKKDPFHLGWAKLLNGNIFGGLRGDSSVSNLLSQAGIQLPKVGDAAFYMHEQKKSLIDSKMVLINMGSHKEFDGIKNSRMVMEQFCDYLHQNGYLVKFLPLHEIDVEIGKNLIARKPEIELLQIPALYSDIKVHVDNACFVIGERLHFIVTSIMRDRPFLSVNYEKKHYDLLASVKGELLGENPVTLTLEKCITRFSDRNQLDMTSVRNAVAEFKRIQSLEAEKFKKQLN